MELSADTERELAALAERFGAPRVVASPISDSFDDPIRKRDRFGEVCMVIRRRNGRLLLSIKTFYPRGAYRLPTGGIRPAEAVYDALVRETYEETGLEFEVRRFLARISYRAAGSPDRTPLFHTFAFLVDEIGGRLSPIDTKEQIEDWQEVAVADLPNVARFLDRIRTPGTRDIGGDWGAWGKFRAVAHRVVHQALVER